MKVIIAGGRDFKDDNLLRETCNNLTSEMPIIEVVCGGAKGADERGQLWAYDKGYKVTLFKADWNKHGKAAGPIRNEKMAKYADVLIAFWDSKSRGTKSMIDLANKYDLTTHVIRYE